ncbi:peptidase M24, structural domain-containing protein [Lentinula boryana]|uniref:Methionine aminopeptidase n=1 Tax=Lentinula boryana TaxID=40481 RepID=A0ABQ8Q8K6_9AGAR|nr:peptidase M24, structural domain-containing protein [Lentinula boryana]
MFLRALSLGKTGYHLQASRRILRLFSSSTPSSSEDEPLFPVADNFGFYNVILPEEPFVFGVSHIKPREVPKYISRPPYAILNKTSQENLQNDAEDADGRFPLGGEAERKLRTVASLAKDVREYAGSLVKVGTTTNAIDAAVHEYIISRGAYPSPLLYNGFPKSCCTSINNVITHGIPDDRPLEDGDIINVDITVYLNGYHGDTSKTWLVGDVDLPGRLLCNITNSALEAGIAACGPGQPFKNIGRAIHTLIEPRYHGMDFCVSPAFSGHGIGSVFHRKPWILHHLNDEPGVMLPGNCFTIEPAIIQGTHPTSWTFPDGWTASTENCARSAQAEHMVLITDNGAEVLTR